MQGELSWRDALLLACTGDQPLRSCRRFPRGYHPGDDVAREQIEHHVERVGDPLTRPWQARYVPGPNLVWGGSHQARRLPMRVPSLWAALGHFVGVVQHPIHRADRTQIPPLLQQGGVHRRRGSVQEPIFVERVQHLRAFLWRQRTRQRSARRTRFRHERFPVPINRGTSLQPNARHAGARPTVGASVSTAALIRRRRSTAGSGGSPAARRLFFGYRGSSPPA